MGNISRTKYRTSLIDVCFTWKGVSSLCGSVNILILECLGAFPHTVLIKYIEDVCRSYPSGAFRLCDPSALVLCCGDWTQQGSLGFKFMMIEMMSQLDIYVIFFPTSNQLPCFSLIKSQKNRNFNNLKQ